MSEAKQGCEQVIEAARMVARSFANEVKPDFREQIEMYCDAPLSGLDPEAQKLADRGASQLKEILAKRASSDNVAEWDDYLDASYAELFLGATMQTIAPQESVYFSPERVMYQQPYFEVVESMKEWGWKVPADFHEPEDHIAAEWLFYLFLLDEAREQAARNAVDAELKASMAASSFKLQHMDSWNERAFKDIVEADDVGFYTGMVYIARALLQVMK